MAYPIPNFAGSSSGSPLGDVSSLYGGGDAKQMNFPSFGGTNQYMNYPSMTGGGYGYYGIPTQQSYNIPGVAPQQGFPIPNTPAGKGGIGATDKLPGGLITIPTADPNFTASWANYLQSQTGMGASPFNLSAFLPSTGGFTGAGQLSPGLTPELQQLAQFLQTGQGGGAGAQTLEQLATTGLPTDAGPAWQAMLAREQRNIGENANQLREQFAGMGDLNSSPFGTAISDFYTQTALGQNAQLTQAEQAAQEAATGRMAGASSELFGAGQGMGEFLQGLDQQSIQNLYNEFIRTSPDYSPLLGYENVLATLYPPTASKGGFGPAFSSAFGGALGGSLGTFGLSNKSGTMGIGGF